MTRPGVADYPLAETRGDTIRGKRGLALDTITLNAVLADRVTMEDLQITPQALRDQADIALDAGRRTLGLTFHRAAELVGVPQDVIKSTCELLRHTNNAPAIADFLAEAALIYEKRGVFTDRF